MKVKGNFWVFTIMILLTTLSVQKASSKPPLSPCRILYEEYIHLHEELMQIRQERQRHRHDPDRKEYDRLFYEEMVIETRRLNALEDWEYHCRGRQEGPFLEARR
jgi:hypothetical protein